MPALAPQTMRTVKKTWLRTPLAFAPQTVTLTEQSCRPAARGANVTERSWGFIFRTRDDEDEDLSEVANRDWRWIGLFAPFEGGRRIVPYEVRIRITRTPERRLVCTGLRLGVGVGGQSDEIEVTTRSLREIRLDEILTQLALELDQPEGFLRALGIDRAVGTTPASAPAHRRPGRRGHPLEHYEAVARTYREAQGRKPVKLIMERYHIAEPTARRWVRQARDRALLGPAIPGKAGEQPLEPPTEVPDDA